MNETMRWDHNNNKWEGEAPAKSDFAQNKWEGEAPAEPGFDQNKTQIAGATQMVMEPETNATQFAANVTCPVCETPNPPSETYCIDCGFMLSSAPVALEDMPEPEDLGKLVTPDGTREFVLKSGENSVGRENADILLTHNTVSRRHAKITVQDGHVCVTDFGSTNGTFVDGRRLTGDEAVEIKDGAELMFGSMTVKFQAPLAPIEEASEESALESEEETEQENVESSAVEPDVEPETEVESAEGEPAPVGKLIANDGSMSFDIANGENTIGRRDGDNTIVISDPYISGRHADLHAENGLFIVTDVGSTNGTSVNGVRLQPNEPKDILDGDEITIGQKVFRIEVA
ncbi:FHA domain-containing protein [bacterium]|nr:FHA domain-containing protein [bacterium]